MGRCKERKEGNLGKGFDRTTKRRRLDMSEEYRREKTRAESGNGANCDMLSTKWKWASAHLRYPATRLDPNWICHFAVGLEIRGNLVYCLTPFDFVF